MNLSQATGSPTGNLCALYTPYRGSDLAHPGSEVAHLGSKLPTIRMISGPRPAPPNYPLRYPKCHLIETRRPLIEVHWGSRDTYTYHVEGCSDTIATLGIRDHSVGNY